MNERVDNKPEFLEDSSSIDFMKIFKALKKHKRLYFVILPLTFLVAVVYTLSLPNYYRCTVKLSPEISGRGSGSTLGALAKSFGVNIGSANTGTEALFPTLYPALMNSVDFKTSLFEVKVKRDGDDKEITYYDYISKGQKKPWWRKGYKLLLHLILGEGKQKEETIDPFRLTPNQALAKEIIDSKVTCEVDKKSMVISITVVDQDPYISATMADSVKERLQRFITDYRTSKARVDLKYNKKLYGEAKARYEKARNLYAEFSDHNQDVIMESVRTKMTDLENEMQLQYNIYQQVVTQLQEAEMKVQEETPAFTTLQSATVPLVKDGPGRVRMCLMFLIISFVATTLWILYKEGELKDLLGVGGKSEE